MADLSIRLDLPGGGRFGPGKAKLIHEIARHGSLSAAARALGMSYPKALRLVEDMNAQFSTPLVETFHGGASRGGATVTENGHSILAAYEAACRAAHDATKTIRSEITRRAKAH